MTSQIYKDLENKTVIVTGASRGIGASIAKGFLSQGAKVVVISRTEIPWLSDFDNKKIIVLNEDIQNLDFFSGWLGAFTEEGGSIDILVNNAGIILNKKLVEMEISDWDSIFNINTKYTFFFTQLILQHMLSRKSGNIIFSSSFAANIPSYKYGAYAASKASISSITKSLAGELGNKNIRVNSVSAGVILSSMTNEEVRNRKLKMLQDISLNRFGEAQEVANGVLFLASEASSYIHGANLDISGGKFVIQNPGSVE